MVECGYVSGSLSYEAVDCRCELRNPWPDHGSLGPDVAPVSLTV